MRLSLILPVLGLGLGLVTAAALTDMHPLHLAAGGVAVGFLLALEGDRARRISPDRLLPQLCIALGGIIIGAAILVAVLVAATTVPAQAIGLGEMVREPGVALDKSAG